MDVDVGLLADCFNGFELLDFVVNFGEEEGVDGFEFVEAWRRIGSFVLFVLFLLDCVF